MLQISTVIPIEEILGSKNLAVMLTEQERTSVAHYVIENFETDRMSRYQWEEKMEASSKIALQVEEEKNFPWPGAANVKFPLLTIACLQYHSRVYPALVDGSNLVKCAPFGQDPKGEKAQAAARISEHMSWQLLEEDQDWESETDKAYLVQPLMGCVFKKTYFDPTLRHNISEVVLPQDLVVPYFTKSLDKSPRITHILTWDKNAMESRIRRGTILDVSTEPPRTTPQPFGKLEELRDKSQGLSAPTSDLDQPFIVLEHHCWLDLDGDNFKEPYVVLVKYDSRELLRIVPRFLEQGLVKEVIDGVEVLVDIKPEKFFTKIPFIPSPDGGFYDLGFGVLLGPLNKSIDTAINQLFDAGTLKNAGGGFLGRGARIKRGEIMIRPGQYLTVDSTGDDLRKSIVAHNMPEPSPVLFQLLSILIDYGQRVAGAPDVIQGQNPGQNTPAETSRNMMEQGIKVFSGCYKRTYRAFKDELRIMYRLNQLHLAEQQEFISLTSGLPTKALAQDYELPSSAIAPVADPYYMSDSMRMNQANALLQAAHSSPGYDLRAANLFFLKAWKIPAPETFIPVDEKGQSLIPPTPNPKIQIEQMRMQIKQMDMQQKMRIKVIELMDEHDLNRARIMQLEAQAALAAAQAEGVSRGHTIAELEASIGVAKLQQEGRIQSIKLLQELIESTREEGMSNDGRGIQSMASAGSNKAIPGKTPGD